MQYFTISDLPATQQIDPSDLILVSKGGSQSCKLSASQLNLQTYILSAQQTSSLAQAKVNVVSKAQYLQLSADGALVSSEIYAIDGNVLDSGSKITVQRFTEAGNIATDQTDLSVLCLSSFEQFKEMAVANSLQDNAIYKISSDIHSSFGKRITDVAQPLEANDAVNLDYFQKNAGLYKTIVLEPISEETGYLSVWLDDCAINSIDCGSTPNQVLTLVAPSPAYVDPQDGKKSIRKSRDFLVHLNIGSGSIVQMTRPGETIYIKSGLNEEPIDGGGEFMMTFTEISCTSNKSTFLRGCIAIS